MSMKLKSIRKIIINIKTEIMKQKIERELFYIACAFILITVATWIVEANEFTDKINYLIWLVTGIILPSIRVHKIKK